MPNANIQAKTGGGVPKFTLLEQIGVDRLNTIGVLLKLDREF